MAVQVAGAATARPPSFTQEGAPIGTPGYMSPEQAQDARQAKKPADVFSMGATLYALLIGRSPFYDSTPVKTLLHTIDGNYKPIRDVRPDISAPTAALLERCLAVDPEKRFSDANALLKAQEKFPEYFESIVNQNPEGLTR